MKTLSSVKNMYESSSQSSTRRQHLQTFSASKSCSTTTTSFSRDTVTTPAVEASSYQNSNTIVKPQTPVLFSTQRGLHLRLTKATAIPSHPASLSCSSSSDNNRKPVINGRPLYDIKFCDLERWSTNRANHIGLDDTNASRTFTVQKNSSFVPTRQSMVRFDTSDT